MSDDKRRRAVFEVVWPALLVTLQLSVFGPHTIYSGNEGEFTASFWALERHLVGPACGLFAALVALGVAGPARWRRGYVSVLFAVGIVLWIQANLLVADYGPLDGNAIDWSVHDWRNKYEIALWAGIPAAAVLTAARIAPIAPFASGMLVAVQAVLVIASTVQTATGTRAQWRGPSEAMFDLSTRQNVVHIVLDTFHSDVFGEILDAERQSIDRDFSGFVFFADHAGAFPTTMVSIPAMLTGTVYRNEGPLQEYIDTHFMKGSLYATLRSQGYRVDSVTEMRYDNKSATNFFRLPRPYVSYETYTRFTAWQLADLSVFRHLPHIARPFIYNDQAWRLQKLFGQDPRGEASGRSLHPVNAAVVLDEFARRVAPKTDTPLYKFIHVGIPHLPVAVNANCEFTGIQRYTRQSYRAQARCGLMRVAALLNRLRELGLYDSSLIVISSDHGNGIVPRQFQHDRPMPDGALSVIAGKAMALLLVKPPKAAGPLRVSSAPTAITDIPATIADILGLKHSLPGTSALKLAEDQPRPRQFAMYDWEHENWRARYFEHLDLMEINGPLRDGGSWTLRGSLYAPDADAKPRLRGLFDQQRNSRGVVYRWSAPHVFLHAPPTARGFEITIRSIAPQPQTVTFRMGTHVLETVTLKDQEWVTLRHQLEPGEEPSGQWIEMNVDPSWRPRHEGRRLGVMTRDIKWMPQS
jgi:hypothetical protein